MKQDKRSGDIQSEILGEQFLKPLHSTIGYVTPEQMRTGQAEAIFEQRNSTMRQAHAKHPKRWGTRSVKQWEILREAVIKPDKVR